jgi:GNAT superfamily N-acetyltransferase
VSYRIERVSAADTFPLRQQVLRPDETHDELAASRDGDAGMWHFAVLDAGAVIGSAAVGREAAPWAPEREPSWRLRGMATVADRRNEGVGGAVLDAVVDHVGDAGGGLLWCNARVPARSFYERAGFTTRGESWDDPRIGPHIAMELQVESRVAANRSRAWR